MNKILISICVFFISSISIFLLNIRHPEENLPMSKVPFGIVPESVVKQIKTYQDLSPHGTIRVDVQAEGRLHYSVKLDGQLLVVPSGLGLAFAKVS